MCNFRFAPELVGIRACIRNLEVASPRFVELLMALDLFLSFFFFHESREYSGPLFSHGSSIAALQREHLQFYKNEKVMQNFVVRAPSMPLPIHSHVATHPS